MAEQQLRCPHCADRLMALVEKVDHPDGRLFLQFYACASEEAGGCGKKAALWWELTGSGVGEAEQTWLEKEVARRGHFFPADYR